jgi:hypothetical protein
MLAKEVEIIRQVEAGKITAEEAAELLNEMNHAPQDSQLSRKDILEQIADNQISPEEGLKMMNQVMNLAADDNDFEEDENIIEDADFQPAQEFEDIKARWKNWWVIPAVIGAIFTGLGGLWMYKGWDAQGLGWQFWLAWIPIIFGVILLLLSADNRACPWLFIRVHGNAGSNSTVSLNFPLPISFVSWFWNILSLFKPKQVSGDEWHTFKSLIDQFQAEGEPVHIQVNDDEDGGQVQIWIG